MALFVVVVLAVLLVVYATGPDAPTPMVRWWRARRDRQADDAPAVSPLHPSVYQRPDVPPEVSEALAERRGSAEAGLVSGLLAGYVSAEDYRRAMAILAEQDADRQPLVVPDPGDR